MRASLISQSDTEVNTNSKYFDPLLLLTAVCSYCSYRFFEVKGPVKEMYVLSKESDMLNTCAQKNLLKNVYFTLCFLLQTGMPEVNS